MKGVLLTSAPFLIGVEKYKIIGIFLSDLTVHRTILFMLFLICGNFICAQATLEGAKARNRAELQRVVQRQNERALKEELRKAYLKNKNASKSKAPVWDFKATYERSLNYEYSLLLSDKSSKVELNIPAIRMGGIKISRPEYKLLLKERNIAYDFEFSLSQSSILIMETENKKLPEDDSDKNKKNVEIALLQITKAASNGKYYLIVRIKQIPEDISADEYDSYPFIHTFTVGQVGK